MKEGWKRKWNLLFRVQGLGWFRVTPGIGFGVWGLKGV